jgi:Glycosyltransferase family 87
MQGQFEDYVAFYAAGKLVLEGNGDKLYDIDSITAKEHEVMGREVGGTGGLGFFNPPFVAVVFSPLSLLSVAMAGFVLLTINTLLLITVGVALHRLLQIRGVLSTLLFFAAIASLQSVFWLVAHGQFSMLLAMGFLGFYGLQRFGRAHASGLALTLVLFKPQMAILPLLVLLWKRQWPPLKSFTLVATVLIVVSIAVSGVSVFWEYPKFLVSSTGWERKLGIDVGQMYGWNGFLTAVFANHSPTHLITTAIASLTTLGAVIYIFRGPWEPSTDRFALAIGAMVAGAILTNPHIYMQDMVLVGLAVTLGWCGRTQSSILWIGIAGLVWMSQLLTYRMFSAYQINIQTPLLFALFVLLVWSARARPRAGEQAGYDPQTDDRMAA